MRFTLFSNSKFSLSKVCVVLFYRIVVEEIYGLKG